MQSERRSRSPPCSAPDDTALLIKGLVNETADHINNTWDACFTPHELNHSHWASIHENGMQIGLPEDGVSRWKDAPPIIHRSRKRYRPMASEGNRMPDRIGFTGQAIVVTGAGRGLGRLYALDLAARGAQVLVNDVGASMSGSGTDASVADGVVAEIQAAGGSAIASHDSVDNPEGGEAIIKAALSSFGRLDAVVSNAGIYEMTPFEDLSTEQWRRMLQVHLDGAFYLCQPAFRVMKEQGYGRLVLVASNIGAFGQEHAVHYGAAKGGIIGLTNGLANEGAPHGILANAVLPVGRTRMMTDSISDQRAQAAEFGMDQVLDAFFNETTAERVVPLVTFLASRSCELSHHYISAIAGRYARTFIGLGTGWLADRHIEVQAEDIAEHLAEITGTDGARTHVGGRRDHCRARTTRPHLTGETPAPWATHCFGTWPSSPAPPPASDVPPRSHWPRRVQRWRSYDRDTSGLIHLIADAGQGSSPITPFPADLADVASLPSLVTAIIDGLGRIDILVNCAGVSGVPGETQRVIEVSDDTFHTVIAINLQAPFVLTARSAATWSSEEAVVAS